MGLFVLGRTDGHGKTRYTPIRKKKQIIYSKVGLFVLGRTDGQTDMVKLGKHL